LLPDGGPRARRFVSGCNLTSVSLLTSSYN
jgi:hypothetical protein